MDIGDWLRGLGLNQYEAAFRENSIDLEVLGKLTSDDLKELGVASIGHRRMLLAAIEEHSRTSVATPAVARRAAAGIGEATAAERRQLTVMFCDLVGSTALSARLDPEDMRGVLAAYYKCCANLIEGGGGFVAKYMGDGVLAYFGYPQAHEHDAENAVRAALAIVAAAPRLITAVGATLHVRVGIATGIVVVGDLLGSGEAQERGIVGDTPNLAARLQGIAEPDSVVIAEATRKLLGNLFEVRNLGPQDIKGVAGPIRAWIALRPSGQESRFEALRAGGATALVGRDEELEFLQQRWTKAKAGEGQVALISGEAGIGKSRLTAALEERLVDDPHTLRYFCSPQHTDSALHPILAHMERAARFAREDDAKTKLDKLDALLATSSTSREDSALLAEMLSLPNDGRYPAPELSPQQRRQRTMEALIVQIEVLARQTPVLMIFEDAQWADPSSLEAFGGIVEKIDALRVLLIVTFRPEFVAPWIGRPRVAALAINRLAPGEVLTLIDRVAGNQALAEDVRRDIVERTDGVPLFVEEMTKAVLEAEGESAAVRAPSPRRLAIPASLHASLMARLDRLGNAKGVAQIGAAIGREFSHALLAAAASESEAELGSALDRLIQAGLVFRRGSSPDAIYLFRHALVQDAAYGTLLREPRRALHARIAEAIERQFPDLARSQPELLARHCAEAGQVERAAGLWGAAGRRSLARSALVEAVGHLKRALALIELLPRSAALRREETNLQIALMTALYSVKGYAAAETKEALERMRGLLVRAETLGEPLDNPLAFFAHLDGLWTLNYVAFDGDALIELANQYLLLAEEQNNVGVTLAANFNMASTLSSTGSLERARVHFDRAVALFPAVQPSTLIAFIGWDYRFVGLADRAVCLWLLGYPDAALKDCEQALLGARESGNFASFAHTVPATAFVQLGCGRYDLTIALADELEGLSRERDLALFASSGKLIRGSVAARTGSALVAAELITTAEAVLRNAGTTVWTPETKTSLAIAHARLGRFDLARQNIRDALDHIERTKETMCEADVHRTAGEIALLSPDRDTAGAHLCFWRALDIARAQQARSWELRAATSLALLWRDQGKRQEAHDLLAPVYGWFTEGFGTKDLKEAKALLEELETGGVLASTVPP
ncbi:MAG: AAA family ATPase [Hyphomicrobiales bacterium]|nr:AAA family ATPase [Hyphomicrobiales bacterium]